MKLTTENTNLPQHVLSFIADRKREGFSYFEKSPRRNMAEALSEGGKWHLLTEKDIALGDGEKWFIRYDNGLGDESFTVCMVNDPISDEDFDSYIDSPECRAETKRLNLRLAKMRKASNVSPRKINDFRGYIEGQLEYYKSASQMARFEFQTKQGESIDLVTNREFMINQSPKWRELDKGRGYTITSRRDAKDAGEVFKYMTAAIDGLEREGHQVGPEIYKALEHAFRAGRHAAAADLAATISNAAKDAAMRRNRAEAGKPPPPKKSLFWHRAIDLAKTRADAKAPDIFKILVLKGYIEKDSVSEKFRFAGDTSWVSSQSIIRRIRRRLSKKDGVEKDS